MACHQEVLLDLNADCAEFCPVESYHELLAVGSYQLNEGTRERHGRLYLYSLRGDCEQQAPHLKPLVAFDLPGIFDLKWTQSSGQDSPRIGLALADGTLRILSVQQDEAATSADPAFSDNKQDTTKSQTTGPFCDPMRLQQLCSCQAVADSMALYLDWHPQQQGLCAISSSAGSISLLQIQESGVQQLHEWTAHDLEAWVASWDRHQGNVLYSGSDDCSFKGWDIRLPTSGSNSSPAHSEGQQTAIFTNRKTHSAGVTSISGHPRREHVLVTGSYDERVRLWDVRMIQKPVETCQVATGGGVWRLKWHPHDDRLLLAACMYNGLALVTAAEDWGSLEVVEEYKGHESIAYGADWYQGSSEKPASQTSRSAAECDVQTKAKSSQFGKRQQQEQQQQGVSRHEDLIATCSFYDRRLHLWSPHWPLAQSR